MQTQAPPLQTQLAQVAQTSIAEGVKIAQTKAVQLQETAVAQLATEVLKPAVKGDPGIGDPYYPLLGNGGYDVIKYTIALDVDPTTNTVNGTTTIEAIAQERLGTFNLDFYRLNINIINVNDMTARFTRSEGELTIIPVMPLDEGKQFTVKVTYNGVPKPIKPVSSVSTLRETGWFHAQDGKDETINVFAEPNGASSWYPVNNHPSDKATYRFEITVPKTWIVAASGHLSNTINKDDKMLYIWEMNQPMASYLASINIGKYKLFTQTGPNGIVVRDYFPEDYPPELQANFQKIPDMLTYFSKLFGPYPFNEYGVVIASGNSECAKIPMSLETQSMSVHCPSPDEATEEVIAHELVHQWFGDNVSLKRWQDIWLKEGIATYAQWLWTTHNDGDMKRLYQHLKDQRKQFIQIYPIGKPPVDQLYRKESYIGGAFVFHALRLTVGDEKFFKILQTYQERYWYSNAGTSDFIAVAEEISGQDLKAFFFTWLYSNPMPEQFPQPIK